MIEWINEKYTDLGTLSNLHRTFAGNLPFQHIFLADFLKEEKAEELRELLKKEEFEEKNSDLFQFKQTKDLSGSEGMKKFYGFLQGREFAEFMQKLTGITVIPSAIDVSGTLYENTDYLLCHDDQLEGRKIAYIFYLGDNLSEEDGGNFALLSSDSGKPGKKIKKYPANFNGFMAFKVSKESFHEVEEVIAEKKRYAIGGWLH
ncbi:hypothetical protein CO038_03140 [Candidatus Pacearchaeota archaeon CG_4_9_14_0_2_um_filter_39_13]|nr:hypothetical protein [Candidatus Pacearchaeota archaeon]OIO42646.1 MAG: hypothetical protein AUJ64_03680 [Candidatus Pacearchaeota archaeon CG1_02_39_14]PJC44562.1 MAG: hypothetical protein CO038_03140 [Candidatus Pacearchaeota archaeon CG_4_9_14_0_2_um_filter_39_13]